MDIRPEIGAPNPSWLDQPDLYRGSKDYSNAKYLPLYGRNPEDYKDELERLEKELEEKETHGWNEDYSDFEHGRVRPKTQAEIDADKDQVEQWLDMNNHMAWDDPHSPIQRMNQPMGAYISTHWKKKNGDYWPAQSFREALLDDQTGGSFKDTLKNQSDGERQEWLNQNHGGRGMGYMGQNAFHRQPSAYGPGTTNNMDERKANVQANALRFFRSRGYRV